MDKVKTADSILLWLTKEEWFPGGTPCPACGGLGYLSRGERGFEPICEICGGDGFRHRTGGWIPVDIANFGSALWERVEGTDTYKLVKDQKKHDRYVLDEIVYTPAAEARVKPTPPDHTPVGFGVSRIIYKLHPTYLVAKAYQVAFAALSCPPEGGV